MSTFFIRVPSLQVVLSLILSSSSLSSISHTMSHQHASGLSDEETTILLTNELHRERALLIMVLEQYQDLQPVWKLNIHRQGSFRSIVRMTVLYWNTSRWRSGNISRSSSPYILCLLVRSTASTPVSWSSKGYQSSHSNATMLLLLKSIVAVLCTPGEKKKK